MHITTKRALRLLRDAVKGKGYGHVYVPSPVGPGPSCLYACRQGEDLVPDCIVGHVMAALGVPLSKMEYVKPDEDADGPVNPYSVDTARMMLPRLKAEGITFDDEALDVFAAAQFSQDAGAPWGQALADAYEVALKYED